MTSWKEQAFRSALKMIENDDPKNLIARAQPEAADRGETLASADLTEVLQTADTNSPLLGALGMQVHKWDAAPSDLPWTNGTPASSTERRLRISELLGLDSFGHDILLEWRPIFRDETIIITAPWDPWYTAQRAAEHEFYWPHYRDYLLNIRGWPEENVTSLDLATTDVVSRLADPTRSEVHQSKGLVVGYVQSGKTANFTGVIAKAIDAGYRLVIVMTGTIEILRSQTQRRIDMEMVGRQNILGDIPLAEAQSHKIDYYDDEEWMAGHFLDLGHDLPVEIHRLTQHNADYQKKLGAQFQSLKIDRSVPGLPLYRPENLFKSAARLAIVKKNATVLKKLVGNIQANKKAFAEIPVLIIDDESDEASVNTVDPEKVSQAKAEGKEVKDRKAINQCIADLLELLPRAQYVGYTATPFANVFTDPSDPLGIFPKDFVLGLRRPPGYMGVDDFHDSDELLDQPRNFHNSNELAHVRHLEAPEDDIAQQDLELRTAIDMFVLTGAVKLYRTSMNGELTYRHHTMLVHHSVKKDTHWALAERVKHLWITAEFSKPAGRARLRRLYDDDIEPVSEARQEEGLPPPPTFDDLEGFIPQAISRITSHGGNPTIVVNSDKEVEQANLDFDRTSTWRILIGGAKLSRGFTIEGLTVTYFRRATNMNSSLTQMGRWFGFRPNYRDLVRLYIARKARFGMKEIDLYEAFAGIAMDESAFREQLERYAEWDGDSPRVLPSQIPPLVTQHLSWLLPTAKNKMFNAVLVEQAEQAFRPAGYANDAAQLLENLEKWRPILGQAQEHREIPQAHGSYKAYVGLITPAQQVLDVMDATHYLPYFFERTVLPKTRFYRRLIQDGLLEDFLIVVPQPDSEQLGIRDVGVRSVVLRDRREGRGGKFGEITEPRHRLAMEKFVDGDKAAVGEIAEFTSPRRGAVLLYLATETTPTWKPDTTISGDPEYGLVAAFSVYVPSQAMSAFPNLIQFRVRDAENEGLPIVDVSKA